MRRLIRYNYTLLPHSNYSTEWKKTMDAMNVESGGRTTQGEGAVGMVEG